MKKSITILLIIIMTYCVSFFSNSQPVFQWAKGLIGNGNNYGTNLCTGNNGDIYLGGYFTSSNLDVDPGSGTKILSSNGGQDIFIARYNKNGIYKNAFSIGGSANDEISAMAVDKDGNLYITGWFQSATVDFDPGPGVYNLTNHGSGTTDIFIAKYDSNLKLIWAYGIGGIGNDAGYDLKLDNFGNIYLIGIFRNSISDFDPGPNIVPLTSNGDADIFVAKFSLNGTLKWVKSFGGSGWDLGLVILPDKFGNFYITGRFWGANVDFDPGPGTTNYSDNGNGDYFVAKYDSNCNFKWVSVAGGSANDCGHGLTSDSAGNIYVTGSFGGSNVDFDPGTGTKYLSSNGSDDAFFAKYDTSGNLIWVKSFGGAGSDIPAGIVINNYNLIFISGYFASSSMDADPGTGTHNLYSNGMNDIFLSEFDTSGKFMWSGNLGGSEDDISYGAVMDKFNNLYLRGYFSSPNIDMDLGTDTFYLHSTGNPDIFFEKYSFNKQASAQTKPATAINSHSAILNGLINANNSPAQVTFDYGETKSYGSTVNAVPDTITGDTNKTVSFNLTGLKLSFTYYFRVKAENLNGTVYGSQDSFITTVSSINSNLSDNQVKIYSFGKNIRINTNSASFKNDRIVIENLIGQQLINRQLTGKEMIVNLLDYSQGYYFVKYISGDNLMVKKVFIQ